MIPDQSQGRVASALDPVADREKAASTTQMRFALINRNQDKKAGAIMVFWIFTSRVALR